MLSPKKDASRFSAIPARTALQAGNRNSDYCYVKRNTVSFECAFKGWPQKDPVCWRCAGNNNESELKWCLYYAGEPDWWKPFRGCTSSQQCFDTRSAIIKVD
jgi:hypothetical protein